MRLLVNGMGDLTVQKDINCRLWRASGRPGGDVLTAFMLAGILYKPAALEPTFPHPSPSHQLLLNFSPSLPASMTSPNPFDNAQPVVRTPIDHGVVHYGDVPSLSAVVYRRGRATFLLRPYSTLHAYMTGNYGTPTRGRHVFSSGAHRKFTSSTYIERRGSNYWFHLLRSFRLLRHAESEQSRLA